jgi:hypothetical protein
MGNQQRIIADRIENGEAVPIDTNELFVTA